LSRRSLRTWVNVLMVVWAGLIIGAFAMGALNSEGTRRSDHLLQLASSPLLVLVALLLWGGGSRGTPRGRTGGLVAGAMALSCVGDLIMGGHIPTPVPMIFGMLAFGAAHVCYIAAWLALGRVLGAPEVGLQRVSIAIMWVVAVVLWLLLVRAPQQPALLNYGSLGYSLLLCGMAGVSVALASRHPRLVGIPVGALLFVASDVILGNNAFRHTNWYLVGDMIWWTYIAGQALMVWTSGMVPSAFDVQAEDGELAPE